MDLIYYLASFDDGNAEDVRLADLMAKYEIPTIFYWPAFPEVVNKPKGRSFLTFPEAYEISKNFAVGSHTLTHPILTAVEPETAQYEISQSRIDLINSFKQPVDTFCYPRGKYNQQIKEMVKRAGYKMARTTDVGHITPAIDPLSTPTAVHIGYPRKEYGDLHWLSYAKKLLKSAKQRAEEGKETHFHIWGHGFEVAKYNAWSDLEALLREMNR